MQAARLGVRSCAGLEVADGNDLILGPDSDGEGAGSVVQNSVGLAAEPKGVRQQVSFLTKHRQKYTCEPCGHSSCEIYRCHCQGFERSKNQGGKGASFGAGIAAPFVASLPVVGAGLILR
jgi:hypothetical protein